MCSGLHKPSAETPLSPLATDGVFGNGENSVSQLGAVNISLESSSSSSFVNGHQRMSYNAGHLLPGPPSSKMSSVIIL